MVKDASFHADAVLMQLAARVPQEKPLSPEEREEIIQFVISSQMIEGFELDYDRAAELIDIAYSRPLPVME